ncbi:MAG: hypothetical protein M3Q49_18170 [Actinomycetota bacterium]|nr:hypothetical protein [Actinomycetota bacterium]
MNHYCDFGFWRASDQAEVARHLTNRTRTTSEPDAPRHAGLVESALLGLLRLVGLAGQPVEREEAPVREGCGCGGEEYEYREPVLDDGEWVLRCPECGHLDRLGWLSAEARPLVLGLARRSGRLRLR